MLLRRFAAHPTEFDHAKSFEEVKHHGQRAEWGTALVKTLGYIMCKREEAGNGGVVETEAMLGG